MLWCMDRHQLNRGSTMRCFRLAALVGALLAVSVAQAAAQSWGALAFSENGTAYAFSRNYASKEAAEEGALAECAKYASDCKIYDTFENRCTSLAGSPNGVYGWAWEPVNLSVFAIFDMSQIKGLRAAKTPKSRLIHKLWGGDLPARQQRAIAECAKQGGTECRMVVNFCTGSAGDPGDDAPPSASPPAPPKE